MKKASATQELLKYCEKNGRNEFAAAELCSYSTQVVAGMNYRLVMSTGEGPNSLYEVVIYVPLPYRKEDPKVQSIKAIA